MNWFSWEVESQRHRDRLRKAQKAELRQIAFAARRQRKPLYARIIQLWRNSWFWLRKRLQNRYNEPSDSIRHADVIAPVDPSMR